MDKFDDKKQKLRNIILNLHNREISVEEAKKRFLKEVGIISSHEVIEMEQSLISDGYLTPEEVKDFCNVHTAIIESGVEKIPLDSSSWYHPVYWFRVENKIIQSLVKRLKQKIQENDIEGISQVLEKLKGIDEHYSRKEQLLFPFLEKHGFFGPSKVMWAKDNDIRELLKYALSHPEDTRNLHVLIEEIEGMVFKEDNILFPTSLEMLEPQEWIDILKELSEVGFVYVKLPSDVNMLIEQLKSSYVEEPFTKDNEIYLPTGTLTVEELMNILNTLPVDITFVDKEDRVRYFSTSKDRIFLRTKSVIGRKVQNCHPQKSVHIVEKIISDFREGKKDHVDFWINFKGRYVYIRYFAVRDTKGQYLGTLEVTQDITDIKKLEGERRILDEEN